MSEFICIQVGQCGNQIGGSFWPLLLKEYDSVGTKKNTFSLESFFYHSNDQTPVLEDFHNGNLRARALLIDMEDSVVTSLRTGAMKNLFDFQSVLTSYPGSGNNWGVGFYEHGSEQSTAVEQMLRQAVERCDRLGAFLPFFSLAGGTGSGLGSYIVTLLENFYSKTDRLITCVHPGVNSDVITMPYNVAFAMETLVESASCVFPVDNKSLLDLCHHHSQLADSHKWKPYRNMNSIICKFLLHATSGARYPGPFNVNVTDLTSNLIPYPLLNFLCCSYGPIILGQPKMKNSVKRITDQVAHCEVFSNRNLLSRMNPLKGTVLAACLFGRGSVSATDLREHVYRLQKRVNFVPWGHNVKIGLCSVPPADNLFAVTSLSNSTAMVELFDETYKNFDKLYRRKAHVHHYKQIFGFPDDKFESTKESFQTVISSYKSSTLEIDIPRISYSNDKN